MEVDKNLINRLKVILETLYFGYKINTKEFVNHCETTELYDPMWFLWFLCPTVHKTHMEQMSEHEIHGEDVRK